MNVAITYFRDGGVPYHRLASWGYFMHDKEMISLTIVQPGISLEKAEEILSDINVLVFNRIFSPEDTCIDVIKKAQSMGVKVICDIDDSWMLHKGHLLEQMYKDNRTSDKIIECMKAADMVWTTHELLASDIRKVNPNVKVIPNAINPYEEQWRYRIAAPNVFGWIGSKAHKVDLDLLEKPLKKFWADRTLKWGVSLGGFDVGDYTNSSHFEKILSGGYKAPKDRYHSNTTRPVDRYAQLYDLVGVGLIPLADNDFNKRKSELKALEFGTKGRTVIVSNIHPYTNICTQNNSYLCDDPMEFYWAMRKVEKKPHQAIEKAKQLWYDIQDLYNWDKVCYLRLEQITELWHS